MLTDENHSDIIFFVESLKQQKRKHSMVCGSVGIGRRARLRILWPLGRVGSSPIFRIREYELCKNSYGLRKCRNWQTSKIQVLVSVTLVRVQVPSSASDEHSEWSGCSFWFAEKIKKRKQPDTGYFRFFCYCGCSVPSSATVTPKESSVRCWNKASGCWIRDRTLPTRLHGTSWMEGAPLLS